MVWLKTGYGEKWVGDWSQPGDALNIVQADLVAGTVVELRRVDVGEEVRQPLAAPDRAKPAGISTAMARNNLSFSRSSTAGRRSSPSRSRPRRPGRSFVGGESSPG